LSFSSLSILYSKQQYEHRSTSLTPITSAMLCYVMLCFRLAMITTANRKSQNNERVSRCRSHWPTSGPSALCRRRRSSLLLNDRPVVKTTGRMTVRRLAFVNLIQLPVHLFNHVSHVLNALWHFIKTHSCSKTHCRTFGAQSQKLCHHV